MFKVNNQNSRATPLAVFLRILQNTSEQISFRTPETVSTIARVIAIAYEVVYNFMNLCSTGILRLQNN